MTGARPSPEDESIADAAFLLRTINPRWIISDGAGGWRVASGAFQDLTDPDGTTAMSVYVEEILTSTGRGAANLIASRKGWAVVAITAEAVRAFGLSVVRVPIVDDPNGDAHAHVFGKKTGSTQKRLVAAAERRLWPDDADPDVIDTI